MERVVTSCNLCLQTQSKQKGVLHTLGMITKGTPFDACRGRNAKTQKQKHNKGEMQDAEFCDTSLTRYLPEQFPWSA